MKSGVYRIVNTLNGKCYVGSSVHIKQRWLAHKLDLVRGSHNGVKLQRAWNKYGEESWIWEVVEEVVPEKLILQEREQFWIDKLDSYHNGYNSLKSAYSSAGRVRSQAEIDKMVATRRQRDNYSHSESTKKKISEVQKGIAKGPMSQEQKDLLSKIRLDKGWTPEHLESVRINMKNRVYTEAIRANMGAAHRSKKASDDTKRRQSEAAKGKPKPEGYWKKFLLNRRDKGQHLSEESCEKYGIVFIPKEQVR